MAKIYIETYGCALNQADSETMAGLLQSAGYELVDSPDSAELIIINSCTVKERTYLNFVKRLDELKSRHTPLLIAGCIPGVYAHSEILRELSFIDVTGVSRIVEVVEEVLAGKKIQLIKTGFDSCRLRFPAIHFNPVIDIVPIAQGCLGECSYCQTRLARGELHSYPVEQIIARIRRSIAREKVKEIWLTAQDTGAYGLDAGTNLIQLLRQITEIEGEFRVRLGMANPEHVLPIAGELLEIMTDSRFYKFLHLPLQSGSDRVLRAMRRKYTVKEYMLIVQAIRNHWQEFSLATDIIAGFPAESEADFQQTLQILEEIRPAVINRSHYSARPFTPAAKLPQLPSAVISERSRRLSQLVEKLCREDNQRWLGWNGEVLIDMQKDPESLISRNFAYKPIIIPLKEQTSVNVQCPPEEQRTKDKHQRLCLGEIVKIKVTGTTTFHLIGRVEMPAEISVNK